MNDTNNAPYGQRPEAISDDDQRERDGLHPTEYDLGGEAVAQRHEIERQLESLLESADDWLANTNDSDARTIVERLRDVYDMLGNAPEEDSRS